MKNLETLVGQIETLITLKILVKTDMNVTKTSMALIKTLTQLVWLYLRLLILQRQ